MIPESPIDPRQALEASLTALLLGELPPDQAAFLRQVMAGDPELAKMHQRLKQTIELVRETETEPADQPATEPSTLKLSDERRQQLLQHFKTIAPREFAKPPRRRVPWLVPVAAAVALLALIGSMLLPALSRSKTKAMGGTWSMEPRELSFLRRNASVASPPPAPAVQNPALFQEVTRGRARTVSTGVPETPGTVRFTSLGASGADKLVNPGGIVRPSKLPNSTAQSTAGQLAMVGNAGNLNFDAGNRAAGEFALLGPKSDADKPLMLGMEFDKISSGISPGPVTVVPVQSPVPVPAANGQRSAQTFNYYSATGSGGRVGLQTPSGQNLIASASGAGGHGGGGYGGGAYYGGGIGGGIRGGALPAATPPDNLPAGTPAVNLAGSSLSKPEAPAVPLVVDPTTGLPVAAVPRDAAVVEKAAGEAMARRYGITASGKAGQPTIDPATGLPAGAVQPVDPTTGLPIAVFERKPGQAPMSSDAIRRQLVNSAEPARNEAFKDATSILFPEEKKVQMADSAATSDTPTILFSPGTGDRFRKLFDKEGEKPQSAERLRMEEESILRAKGAGTNRFASLDAGLRGFYDDEAQKLKDSKEVAGKERSMIVLPQAQAQEQLAITHDGVLAQGVPLPQLVDSTALGRSEANRVLEKSATNPLKQRAEEFAQLGKKESAASEPDAALAKPAVPLPIPQPEVQTADNAFSTFSLNVSDVSFKLAAASLEKGVLPDPASVRTEEFINAFDYRDPEAPAGVPIAFAWDRTRYPFAQNRDLLRFSLKTAAQGRQAGRPLNLVLLLDNSGSMERADRVQIIREALRVLATQLQPQDTFSVVTFARTAHLWVDGVPGNQAGQVGEELGKLTPQGGTNLGDAMDLAYQTALRHYLANGINRVVLLTDGAANLGDVSPDSLKAKVEANRKQGIALDCFGIGWEGYNDDLLEVLTRNADGRYGFINTPEEAATEFAGQIAGALHVAASDVKVQVEFNPNRVTAYRQLGYAKHQLTKEQFRDNTVNAAAIGAAESGNALYVIEANPAGEGPLATVRVRYRVPGTSDYQEREWVVPYTGNAVALEQSSPAMRLAASASAFSEWLATSPYAAEVTPDTLLRCLSGVPEVYGADIRPKKLEWMVRQAKSVSANK